jgi:hypothetical protein
VLRSGGLGLIEGRPYSGPTADEIRSGTRRGPERRLEFSLIEGKLNAHFRHDEHSLTRLCEAAGIRHFRVFERDWGGRRRLLLRFDKPPRGLGG